MDNTEQQHIETKNEGSSWTPSRIFGLILVVLTVLVTLYIIVGYTAWQSGQAIRQEREDAQLAEHFDHQIALAQDDIGQGSYNLALRRLEWILARDPENANAQANTGLP